MLLGETSIPHAPPCRERAPTVCDEEKQMVRFNRDVVCAVSSGREDNLLWNVMLPCPRDSDSNGEARNVRLRYCAQHAPFNNDERRAICDGGARFYASAGLGRPQMGAYKGEQHRQTGKTKTHALSQSDSARPGPIQEDQRGVSPRAELSDNPRVVMCRHQAGGQGLLCIVIQPACSVDVG
jgi:hypothetical protein